MSNPILPLPRNPGPSQPLAVVEVDRRLTESLPQPLRASLEPKWIDRAPPDSGYGCDLELVEYQLTSKVPSDMILDAIVKLRAVLEPCDRVVIASSIGRVRLLTKSRMESEESGAAMYALFEEKLRAYPADVVFEACDAWCNNEKFFPAWAELKEYLDRRVRKRRLMLAALEKADGHR